MRIIDNLRALAVLSVSLAGYIAASEAAANATPPQHLYVARSTPSGYEIDRFQLVNGFPAKQPDLTISDVVPPMAVGDDGTFYATQPFSSSFGPSIINVYPFGATQPAREASLPSVNDFTVACALAIGPAGYLYAGYYSYISGARVAPDEQGDRPDFLPLHGVAVIGPHAKNAHPVYKFPGIAGGPTWMQIGPQRELYVAGYEAYGHHPVPGHIFVLDQAWNGPNVRSILDTGFETLGIGFSDSTADMYVSRNVASTYGIAVYHRGAHGKDQPFRTFTTLAPLQPSLAIVGNHLFVISGNQLLAYPKDASGSPKPVFVRDFPGPFTFEVAAGP